jgi:hypothetical protein
MAIVNQNMAPGIVAGKTFAYRRLLKGNDGLYLPVGIFIDGSQSRDPLHTSYLDVLRAGTILGQITATNLYSPSIIGVTTVAYSAAGSLNTQLTVSVADATEIVRRIGSSGTFMITGPPTASGTVAEYTAVTYSAVNTATGVITITALGANYIAGSFIQPDDGAQVMRGLLNREDGLKVTDHDDSNIDPAAQLLIGGTLDSSQILRWPSNAVLIQWIKDKLNATAAGQYVFDDLYI